MIDHREQDLICQWFNAVQDINPLYLTKEDYVLAARLMKEVGRVVPDSVLVKISEF